MNLNEQMLYLNSLGVCKITILTPYSSAAKVTLDADQQVPDKNGFCSSLHHYFEAADTESGLSELKHRAEQMHRCFTQAIIA